MKKLISFAFCIVLVSMSLSLFSQAPVTVFTITIDHSNDGADSINASFKDCLCQYAPGYFNPILKFSYSNKYLGAHNIDLDIFGSPNLQILNGNQLSISHNFTSLTSLTFFFAPNFFDPAPPSQLVFKITITPSDDPNSSFLISFPICGPTSFTTNEFDCGYPIPKDDANPDILNRMQSEEEYEVSLVGDSPNSKYLEVISNSNGWHRILVIGMDGKVILNNFFYSDKNETVKFQLPSNIPNLIAVKIISSNGKKSIVKKIILPKR